jgi:hypothetical protein
VFPSLLLSVLTSETSTVADIIIIRSLNLGRLKLIDVQFPHHTVLSVYIRKTKWVNVV